VRRFAVTTSLSVLACLTAAAAIGTHDRNVTLMAVTAGGRCRSVGANRNGGYFAWSSAIDGPIDGGSMADAEITTLRPSSPWVGWRSRGAVVYRGAVTECDCRFFSGLLAALCSGPGSLHWGFGFDADVWTEPPQLYMWNATEPSKPLPAIAPQRSWLVHRLAVPYWFPLAATALVPVGSLVRRCRQRPAGRCHRCGYDLRATPSRCPECGTPTVDVRNGWPVTSPGGTAITTDRV
jgi:hypothetical protein